MGLLTSKSEFFDVKHVKDVIEIWDYWNAGDRFEGDGEIEKRGRLVRIYESKDRIFKTNGKGTLLSSEFKKNDKN